MKQDDKLFRYLLWGMGLLPTLWLALVLAQPVSDDISALAGRLEVLSNALEAPFSLRWTQDCPRLLLLFGLMYTAIA